MGNAQGVARTLARLGRCLLNAGLLDEAARVLDEARVVPKDSRERINEADALVSMGILAHLTGNSSDAIRWYREAISASLRLGDLLGGAHAHRHLAFHYLRLRQPDEAERALQRARALRSEHGAKSESPGILRGLAEVYLARGDLLRAAEYGEQGVSAVADHDRITRATHGATLARVRASQGRGEEAESLFHASMQILEAGEYVIDLALTLLKHGEALLVLGRPEPARPLLERARSLFAEMGATFFVNEVEARLQAAVSSR
jgi:tetratricopeptide (TPR) repeat protein